MDAEKRCGFSRPVIGRVVEKFLGCGDLTKGFARVRCDTCQHEYLLAFVLERSGNPAERGAAGGISARIGASWASSASAPPRP